MAVDIDSGNLQDGIKELFKPEDLTGDDKFFTGE